MRKFIGTQVLCSAVLLLLSSICTDVTADGPSDHAQVARQIVHKSDYTSLATNSASVKQIAGFPMVNVIATADSKRGASSTGNIYFLLTNLDYTGQDLMKSNKLTMLFTQDQDLQCTSKGLDAMDPTCARVIMSGSAIVMDNSTAEYRFGMEAFVDRHPRAETWNAEHNFYLCKVHIKSIIVLDWYGGPHRVAVADYFNHKYDNAAAIELPSSHVSNGGGANDKRTVRIHVESDSRDVVIEV